MLIPGAFIGKGEAMQEFCDAIPESDLQLIWHGYPRANIGIFLIFQRLQIPLKEAWALPPESKIACSMPGCGCYKKRMKVRTDSVIIAIERAKKQIADRKQEIQKLQALEAEKQKAIPAENFRRRVVFNSGITVEVGVTRHAQERYCERFLGMSRQEAIEGSHSLEIFQKISESFTRARKIQIQQSEMHFRFLAYGLAEYFLDDQDKVLFTLSPERKPAVLTITRYNRQPASRQDNSVESYDPIGAWHREYLNRQKSKKSGPR